MPRRARLDAAGTLHHVIIRGIERRRIVDDDTAKNQWQEPDSVLAQIGNRENGAKNEYRRFVAEGVEMGRRPELVGGGLIRSLGGWSEVKPH